MPSFFMETFEQTCYKPYDRHDYKIVFTNKTSKIFDNYMDVQAMWFQCANQFLSHIEVLDKKKRTTPKGF